MTMRAMTAGRNLRRLACIVLVALLGLGVLVAPAHPATSAKPQPKPAPPAFVALDEVDPTILHDIRYTTRHNFVGRRIHGYRQPLCILTRRAANALERAQDALLTVGYSLKAYDCYRPQTAVDDFVRWAERLDDDRMKAEFYPNVEKSQLFEDGYIAARSGHSRGSTVDLTLVRLPAATQPRWTPSLGLVPCYAPKGKHFKDNSIDMGTGYDCFDTLSHTVDPRVQRRSASEPAAVEVDTRSRRLHQLRQRVVALHPRGRTVPEPVLRLPRVPPSPALTGR
jgi:D-alanyl-D-alanine dipeptidase